MDYSKATNEELEQLVNEKNGDAICELAERCMNGTNGHPQNLNRAYQLFHKGEKMGLSRAYMGLGTMYQNGIYFARNENLAREYFAKAGVTPPVSNTGAAPLNAQPSRRYKDFTEAPQSKPTTKTISSVSNPTSEPISPNSINTADIRRKITDAEGYRMQENYFAAKNACNEVIRDVENIMSNVVVATGNDDLDQLKADAYWMLAFIAFNEDRYQEVENYMAKENVQALHPWGLYLVTICHRNMQSPAVIFEQDLQALIMVSENLNLTQQERGDVCFMIAELILDGYGQAAGCNEQMAQYYYEQAAGCGHDYSREQLNNFRTDANGFVQYIG